MAETVGERPQTRRAMRARAGVGAPPPKAGRNLPAATAVGLALIGVVIASLYLYTPLFVGLVTLVAVIGVWELDHALRQGRICAPLPPMLLATGLVPLAYLTGPDGLAAGFAAVTALMPELSSASTATLLPLMPALPSPSIAASTSLRILFSA